MLGREIRPARGRARAPAGFSIRRISYESAGGRGRAGPRAGEGARARKRPRPRRAWESCESADSGICHMTGESHESAPGRGEPEHEPTYAGNPPHMHATGGKTGIPQGACTLCPVTPCKRANYPLCWRHASGHAGRCGHRGSTTSKGVGNGTVWYGPTQRRAARCTV